MNWLGHSKAEMDYFEENQVKSCDTCEMNGPGVCMGPDKTYGISIKETKVQYPHGCECWSISLDHYCDIMDAYHKTE